MTRRISITGIDGSGKTTVIRELKSRFSKEPGALQAFRAPQYHEDPRVPDARLSADIDELSVLADRIGDPLLKATALLLSVTLYGEVERWFVSEFRPRVLLGERQPYLDSLVYSLFYTKLLNGPLDRAKLEPELRQRIGDTGLHRIKSRARELFGEPDALWNAPVHAKKLFSLPPSELLPRLKELYQLELPDEIILLKVSREALTERLLLKRGEGTQKEIHEQQGVLEQLQQALLSCLEPLREIAPAMRVREIDTSSLTIWETCEAVLRDSGTA